jgi:predicted DNA binding CopG/RHH family protein
MDNEITSLNVKIPVTLMRNIKAEAARQGIRMKTFIINIFNEELKKCNQ